MGCLKFLEWVVLFEQWLFYVELACTRRLVSSLDRCCSIGTAEVKYPGSATNNLCCHNSIFKSKSFNVYMVLLGLECDLIFQKSLNPNTHVNDNLEEHNVRYKISIGSSRIALTRLFVLGHSSTCSKKSNNYPINQPNQAWNIPHQRPNNLP